MMIMQRVSRPKRGINEWLHRLPLPLHKKLMPLLLSAGKIGLHFSGTDSSSQFHFYCNFCHAWWGTSGFHVSPTCIDQLKEKWLNCWLFLLKMVLTQASHLIFRKLMQSRLLKRLVEHSTKMARCWWLHLVGIPFLFQAP
nr:uncharacterized protein LOC114819260 [Malus domestica]